ncbi:MAG: glutamyl-tRNA synthetase [Planctomycetaceae bacterium]
MDQAITDRLLQRPDCDRLNPHLLSRVFAAVSTTSPAIPASRFGFNMTVRTRFAPSPTGYMHIGGMRTALFNWLYAKKHGGQFILRIDDTDQQRNVDDALAPILQAFRWLNMEWDEGPEVGGDYGPYFQSQRGDLYTAAADRLLAEGKAYRCFDTPEEVQADKEAARENGKPPAGMRRSLDLSDAEIQQKLDNNDPWVMRFKVPQDRKIEINDEIRGHVEWDAALMFDPNIMRSNGSPLYNFATVVDDAQLKITHVIRAEEHLPNTPTQVLLYEALGEPLPKFAHIPFVMAPGTKKKLSKRTRDLKTYLKNPAFKVLFNVGDDVLPAIGFPSVNYTDFDFGECVEGSVLQDTEITAGRRAKYVGTEGQEIAPNPVLVEFYKQTGFLPAGLLNSLGRTGWSFDETTEFMSLDFLIENFSLSRVVKASAAFDPEKLMSYQAHWMNELPVAERAELCVPFLQKAKLLPAEPSEADLTKVRQVVESLGDRIKVSSDILTYGYFFKDEIEPDGDYEKNFKKRVANGNVPELLAEFRPVLAELTDWSLESIEAALQQFAESKEIGAGLLINALRIVSTGSPAGPGVYDCLVIVGKDTVLTRIDAAIAKATAEE